MLQVGDTVKVHYTGKLEDGYVFDTTVTGEPILFTIGDEMMLKAFEDAVRTMHVGQHKTIHLKASQAYGEYDPDLIYVVKRSEFFREKEIKLGDDVQVPVEDDIYTFSVIALEGEEVKLDGNSELAGKDVVFDIELLDILDGQSDDYESIDEMDEMDFNSDAY
jgi:peptidylprolyl isomerase